MKTDILKAPEIFKSGQVIHCDEQQLRRLPIQKPVDLKREQWILVYAKRNFELANKVYETMERSCKMLQI